jgi:hypothetical protein
MENEEVFTGKKKLRGKNIQSRGNSRHPRCGGTEIRPTELELR